MYSYPLIIEILEYAHALGEIPAYDIMDTAPWVKSYTTPGGTVVPDGWAQRPPGDGFHWLGYAVDIGRKVGGGANQPEIANWWLDKKHLLLELIHKLTPGRGYVVKNGIEIPWTSAWDHEDHVHVAMEPDQAKFLRSIYRSKWNAKNRQTIVLGGWID